MATATLNPMVLPPGMLLPPIDVRWRNALLATVALWAFVLAMYLPIIYNRHLGDPRGLILDCATILVSILFAMPIFSLMKQTIDLRPRVRVPILLCAVLVAASVNTVFDHLFARFVATHMLPTWSELPQSLVLSYSAMINYICAFGTNVVLMNLILSRDLARDQERALAEARSAAQTAHLAALRFQINPHFLFNTLNAISSLIVTRRNEQAEVMTDKLSSFLRASLSSDPTALTRLSEELAVVGDYLEIESVRFGARLEASIECEPDAEEALVPGFILQPLVENAVKYGVSPSRNPVRVRIAAGLERGELVLCVSDDGPCEGVTAPLPSTGTGLRNVRQRLASVYGAAARLSADRQDGCFVACIRMPAHGGGQPA